VKISSTFLSSPFHISWIADILNADYDIKTFFAFADCSDGHAIEDLTQLVPLLQTAEDELPYITTQPDSFKGDSRIAFFDKWEKLFEVDSFTDAT
jgi:hypothetical protein